MEPGQSLARSIRLAQMQHLLLKTARGLTTRELSHLCGVTIRTIQRDLLSLQVDLHVPLNQLGDRYSILAGYILPPVSFSLYEAMSLFLASRAVAHQIDESNPHIQSALAKVATALPPSLANQVAESIWAIDKKTPNPRYVHIFEQVAIAWSTQRRMRITYQSLQSTEVKEWLLDPYFVEVTGVGYSAYIIGHAKREGKEGIITFKLDRIKDLELLEESFETPEGLSLEKLLGAAWGVIWGEEVEVKLKFSPTVTRRVKESTWHPSQVIQDLPDGGCIMTLRVGSTLEMTPWIRGWGPDVEVLGPDELRQEFRRWAKQMAGIYQRS